MTKFLTYLILSFITFYLSACTAIYIRQFSVNTEQISTTEEKSQVLVKYKAFMESNGYVATHGKNERGPFVSYRIRELRSRLLPTSRINDTLYVGIDKEGAIWIDFVRISSYPPDDFSKEYIINFVKATENFIRESTGKLVKIEVRALK